MPRTIEKRYKTTEEQYKKDRMYHPEQIHSYPVPGQNYAITGPNITGTYKIKRLRARIKGGVNFMVEGSQTEYDVSKHKFRGVK